MNTSGISANWGSWRSQGRKSLDIGHESKGDYCQSAWQRAEFVFDARGANGFPQLQ